ncbi:MAG: hypothetical protein OEY25_08660 [Candidatus Aminicenantes bacterium]|nr:hypothetical protein [Candidatus Aminicenantes bacterium]MDH5704634.1 hypothetical protein [Candidatus Aminicenantes bacterium]
MEESNDELILAEAASGFIDYKYEYYHEVGKKIVNLQLRYWVEALNRFQKTNEDCNEVEEFILILNLLCSSLETLAGVNINPTPDNYTPPLIKLYEERLIEDKKWNLKLEKPNLFKVLKEMDEYQKNLCKHLQKSHHRKELLKQINYEKIRKYMRTTKEIWLWILDKKFKGNIHRDQLLFFEYDF